MRIPRVITLGFKYKLNQSIIFVKYSIQTVVFHTVQFSKTSPLFFVWPITNVFLQSCRSFICSPTIYLWCSCANPYNIFSTVAILALISHVTKKHHKLVFHGGLLDNFAHEDGMVLNLCLYHAKWLNIIWVFSVELPITQSVRWGRSKILVWYTARWLWYDK